MTDQRKLIPKAARVGVAAISPSIGGPTTNNFPAPCFQSNPPRLKPNHERPKLP